MSEEKGVDEAIKEAEALNEKLKNQREIIEAQKAKLWYQEFGGFLTSNATLIVFVLFSIAFVWFSELKLIYDLFLILLLFAVLRVYNAIVENTKVNIQLTRATNKHSKDLNRLFKTLTMDNQKTIKAVIVNMSNLDKSLAKFVREYGRKRPR